MNCSTCFYLKLNGITHRIQSTSFKHYQIVWEGRLIMEARCRFEMERRVGSQTICHLSKVAQWVSGEGQTKSICFASHQQPTHCLGNPTVECIGGITLFSMFFINANLCKFLTTFLLFPNGALYHLNFKFISKKCC